MKAFTVWQPWATLIMVGAKPFEYRGWPAPRWIIGQDVVIHAGSRAIRRAEVEDLLERLADDEQAWTTGLFPEKAAEVLTRALRQTYTKPQADLFKLPPAGVPPAFEPLPLAAGLGIVRIGEPVDGNDTAERFGHKINDSDRDAQANWGWPMLDIRPFAEPVACKGAQGFWTWHDAERMAAL